MRTLRFFILAATFFAFSQVCFSQQDCRTAVRNLQAYASNVNQMYYNEYWYIIPNQRCPGVGGTPTQIYTCRNQWLTWLNGWYYQQCQLVNSYYIQVANSCLTEGSTKPPKPAPKPISTTGDEQEQIKVDNIDELAAGVDDNKTTRITIPTTADGFRH